MSSVSGDLGTLFWKIDVDDSLLNSKLDAAEAKVRAMGARMDAALNGTGSAAVAGGTFGGGPISPPNTNAGFNPSGPGQIAQQTAQQASQSESYGGATSGYIRPLAVAYLGMRVAQQAISIGDSTRALDTAMRTGTLVDSAQAGLSYIHSQNTGMEGWIHRNIGYIEKGKLTGHWGLYADIDYLEMQGERSVASAKAMESSDAADAVSRKSLFSNQFINARPFAKLVEGPEAEFLETQSQTAGYRQQARRGTDSTASGALINSANRLEAQAAERRDELIRHDSMEYAVKVGSGYFMRGVDRVADTISAMSELSSSVVSAGQAARGDAFGATYTQQSAGFALEEAKQSNPVIRYMMRAAHSMILGSMKAGYDRTRDISLSSMGMELANNPLGAALESTNEEFDPAVRASKKAVITHQFLQQSALIQIGQDTQRQINQSRLDPLTSSFATQAISDAGSAMSEATQLYQGGRPAAAHDALINASWGLRGTRAQYLSSFKAQQVDLRNIDVSNPQDQTNPAAVLKTIDSKINEVLHFDPSKTLGGSNNPGQDLSEMKSMFQKLLDLIPSLASD